MKPTKKVRCWGCRKLFDRDDTYPIVHSCRRVCKKCDREIQRATSIAIGNALAKLKQ